LPYSAEEDANILLNSSHHKDKGGIYMKKYIVMFGLGAFAYGLLEVIWRGHSHWSMMIAGGLCFIIFSVIAEKMKGVRLLYKCILGSLTVTVVELLFGSVFNIVLKMNVWDYSNLPFNLYGQICLLFSVLWGFLSLFAVPFSGAVMKRLTNAKGRSV
jgi:uncharacterized membrane protein